MAGIYIHIPFCKSACHYCNFHFSTSLRYKPELLNALAKEIVLQRPYLSGESLETVYFGGGTPSLCTVEELQTLVRTIRENYTVTTDAEVTIEVNPDDITTEKLEGWKAAGVTRLSIGLQSFFEEDLRWMNRAHTAEQAKQTLELALTYFPNITIDLIYGVPGLTDEKWKVNIDTALSLGIPHLSCYALTVEPKTPLDKLIRTQQREPVDPDKQSDQFLYLMERMEQAGFEHYEISNFAKPGFRSRHNSSYWKGRPYLGIGPSAHSFNGSSRQWNVANNQQYIAALEKNEIPFEIEVLTVSQQRNEQIMIALRTMEGLDVSGWPVADQIEFEKEATPFLNSGQMMKSGTVFCLTKEGRLLADGIAAALFRL